MKKLILVGILFCFGISLNAQENHKENYHKKVKTLDSTIKTLYAVISGEKGEARDWDLFRFLFHADAKLIPSRPHKNSTYSARFMTPEDYIKGSGKWLVENGFHEIELHRKVDTFGHITHVFSSYESYRSKKDKAPFMRGINSIQLLNDGDRWWILNIYWAQESKINPIPKQYLPN